MASGAIRLPGHAASARVALAVLLLASVVVLLRMRPGRVPVADVVPLGAIVLLVTLLPFAATGRVGIVGVLNNADLSGHLVLADALRTGPPPAHLFFGPGYPSGPHSLAAAMTAFGTEVDTSFTAILLAVPVLTALAALAGLPALTRVRRLTIAALIGLPYLGAAYLAQASFKEPIQALLLLTFTLLIGEMGRSLAGNVRIYAVAALLLAAMVVTYSFAGLVWPALIAGAWATVEVVRTRRVPRLRLHRKVAAAMVVSAALLLVAIIPGLDRIGPIVDRIADAGQGLTTGGNIDWPIAPYQVAGVWLSDDFRVRSEYFGAVAAVTVALSLYAVAWLVRRRELVVPAALAACLAIYLQARYFATPYYDAKALVVAAPLFMLLIGRPLMTELPPAALGRTLWPPDRAGVAAVARMGVTGAFLAGALTSTGLALAGTRVLPSDHGDELASLRPLLKDRATLFIGQDDYAFWELRGARLSGVVGYVGNAQVPFTHRPDKPFKRGTPVDFDSFDRGNLDRFEYIVAPRSDYLGSPPPNWHRVRETDSYGLWRRHGPTPNREILRERATPGARFDCAEPSFRALSARRGVAGTRPFPAIGEPGGWRSHGGGRLERFARRFAQTVAGERATQELRLPRGAWNLSLQYVGPTSLLVRAGTMDTTLPPVEERRGPFWPVGQVRSTGESMTVAVEAGSLPPLARRRRVILGRLAATRANAPETTVALSKACGRYVTWYAVADA